MSEQTQKISINIINPKIIPTHWPFGSINLFQFLDYFVPPCPRRFCWPLLRKLYYFFRCIDCSGHSHIVLTCSQNVCNFMLLPRLGLRRCLQSLQQTVGNNPDSWSPWHWGHVTRRRHTHVVALPMGWQGKPRAHRRRSAGCWIWWFFFPVISIAHWKVMIEWRL